MRRRQTAMWKAISALTLLLSMLAQSASAQEMPYVVEGPGRASCAAFTEWEPEGLQRQLSAAWLTGYLTAHNRFMPDIFDLTAWQSPGLLLGLLEQYCAAHPEEIVERGAQELIAYLLPRALTDEADLVTLQNDGSVVFVYRPVLAQVRAALAAAGYAPGSGETGLSDALAAYQMAEQLEQTGLPDQPTLSRLLQ
ncbi:hypothetical protein [Meridianimarinicoccus aquatilis]|uniref:Peptidoglycan-binding protein n=1 Tax=Meridianimarinicoccus aquatilis TaxID=2552766 RepID=A0A4R6AXQ6_9RHOB|nr:hypothetical protein [Fluviibacterium aquatile]TDL89070.1 hypothetical protein E2L05_08180 [Fluviibacterium aquatile]